MCSALSTLQVLATAFPCLMGDYGEKAANDTAGASFRGRVLMPVVKEISWNIVGGLHRQRL